MLRSVFAVTVGLFALIVGMGATQAKCPTVPTLAITFDPAARPPRAVSPDLPTNFPALEVFLHDVEDYRRVSVEGYGISLTRFDEKLRRLDAEVRQAKMCEPAEYETFAASVREEQRKLNEEYRDPYRDGLSFYESDIALYRRLVRELTNGA